MLVRWQEPGAAPKELPAAEEEGADPNAQPIAIEFSAGLEAANGVASGYSGCNRFTGPYEKLVSGMRFGSLATTRMACDPARMELETAFLEALKSPLATVGMQPSASGRQGRQVIWKTASGATAAVCRAAADDASTGAGVVTERPEPLDQCLAGLAVGRCSISLVLASQRVAAGR